MWRLNAGHESKIDSKQQNMFRLKWKCESENTWVKKNTNWGCSTTCQRGTSSHCCSSTPSWWPKQTVGPHSSPACWHLDSTAKLPGTRTHLWHSRKSPPVQDKKLHVCVCVRVCLYPHSQFHASWWFHLWLEQWRSPSLLWSWGGRAPGQCSVCFEILTATWANTRFSMYDNEKWWLVTINMLWNWVSRQRRNLSVLQKSFLSLAQWVSANLLTCM